MKRPDLFVIEQTGEEYHFVREGAKLPPYVRGQVCIDIPRLLVYVNSEGVEIQVSENNPFFRRENGLQTQNKRILAGGNGR